MDLIHDRLAELITSLPEWFDASRVTLKVNCNSYFGSMNWPAFCRILANKRVAMVFKQIELIGMHTTHSPTDDSFSYLMHRTKDLILRDCKVDLTSAPTSRRTSTNLERLTVSNTTLLMPETHETNKNVIKLRSFRLAGMSIIPSNFKHLSQIDNLEEIYVDRIPHFMTRFLAEHGDSLPALKQLTFDRSIRGLQPVTTLLERKKPLDKISFWCGSAAKVSLSRVLEMCYTKVSKQTEILMHDLTVDVSLDGLD